MGIKGQMLVSDIQPHAWKAQRNENELKENIEPRRGKIPPLGRKSTCLMWKRQRVQMSPSPCIYSVRLGLCKV